MGSEHLNEDDRFRQAILAVKQAEAEAVELKARRNRMTQRHLARVRRVPQAQPASPPDGRRAAQMDAERICRGLNVDIYRRADAKVGGWCWSVAHEAFDELEKNQLVPIEGGPLPSRKEAAENAVMVLAQALSGVVRQINARMPSVRS